MGSTPVVTDRLDGATFHGFLAGSLFFGTLRLFVHVGVSAVFEAGEIVRRGFAAQVTVDAIVVDVELTGHVLGISICEVSHMLVSFGGFMGPDEWGRKRVFGLGTSCVRGWSVGLGTEIDDFAG